MDIFYDTEVDSVRIVLQKNKKVVESEPSESNPNIIVDLAEDNSPVAIEILNLKQVSGGIDDYLKQFNFQIAN